MFLSTALALSLAALPARPLATLDWHQGSFEAALSTAEERDTLVALYFWRDGSRYCAEFYQNTLGDPRTAEVLAPYVLMGAKHGTEAGNALFERYGVKTLPTVLFVRADGTPEDAVAGFAETDAFLQEMERISKGELTMSALVAALEEADPRSPEAFELRYRIATKRRDLGDEAGGVEALAAIAKMDRRGKTLHGVRAALDLFEAELGEAPDAWELAPLEKLAETFAHPEGRFEAWNKLADLEAYRKDVSAACEGWSRALAVAPEERVGYWAAGTANWIMRLEGERTAKEREFVLALASRASDAALAMTVCCPDTTGTCGCPPVDESKTVALATLARAQKLNGDLESARATARKCLAMGPKDELREELSALL